MNSTSYDLNLSTGMTQISENILETNSNKPLITKNDIDIVNENNLSTSNQFDHIPLESSPININNKQKSLISLYDNSNDGEPQSKQEEEINLNNFPLVAIIGRNKRSQAFTKRLLLSGFPKPILYDNNSSEINSQQSPSIILITDNIINNFQYLFNSNNNQQLIIDVREIPIKKSIPQSYKAFGNLSNWEIENGTQRIGVAIEQTSPLNLIKFIFNLNCFPRHIIFLDQYSYNNNNKPLKSFHYCIYPLVSTIIIFSLCFILSLFNYKNSKSIYRQASSITATTSITLLALSLLIRPIFEYLLRKRNIRFFKHWFRSRQYFAWYSLSFAFLHIIFLIFSKNTSNENIFFLPFFFGVFSLILLSILSFVYFPWISERLLWHEYHLLTSYLGPFCLLITLIHVFIHWRYDYYYTYETKFFYLKFLSMILPFIVLLLRFIIYGIIYPINKFIKYQPRQNNKTSIIKTKDTTLLP